jgi:hypothetical protein
MTVDWDQPEDSTENTAPIVKVVPVRVPGWNKFTAARSLTQEEVASYFGDAAIVWQGTAAYSHNQATAAMIAATPGVTALDGLAQGDEIWVKY